MIRRSVQIAMVLALLLAQGELKAQEAAAGSGGLLSGVKTVQVDSTEVSNPNKVKETYAPNLVQDSLKKAFQSAGFQVAEGTGIRAHAILDEFTSGSTAKRMLVGFGAGRSAVTCRLVLEDADGKVLFKNRIHVRGALVLSPYQGNSTQRRQAMTSLDQRFLEEIEKMK